MDAAVAKIPVEIINIFCKYFLRVSISQRFFVIVNEWALMKFEAPVNARSTQLTKNGQSFVFGRSFYDDQF